MPLFLHANTTQRVFDFLPILLPSFVSTAVVLTIKFWIYWPLKKEGVIFSLAPLTQHRNNITLWLFLLSLSLSLSLSCWLTRPKTGDMRKFYHTTRLTCSNGGPSLNPQTIDITIFTMYESMGPILEITRAISRNSPLSLAAAAAQFCGTQRRHFQDSETMPTGWFGAHKWTRVIGYRLGWSVWLWSRKELVMKLTICVSLIHYLLVNLSNRIFHYYISSFFVPGCEHVFREWQQKIQARWIWQQNLAVHSPWFGIHSLINCFHCITKPQNVDIAQPNLVGLLRYFLWKT